MIKNIFYVLLVTAALLSCKSKSALNYSQGLVEKEKSLMTDINTTEENVTRYAGSLQYDSIAAAGKKMESIVEAKIKEIKDAPAPDAKGGAEFKEAGLKYFMFIKSMYTAYKDFGMAGSDEQRDIERQKVLDIVGKKNAAIKSMQDAQQKFADDNGFKMEKKF
jgi:hypothetical protein